jgi:hypothetical protein
MFDDDTVGFVNRRPQLQIIAPGASPVQAAAVVAALEQFMRATAPVIAARSPAPAPWQQAALREGVMRDPQPDRSPWM